MKSITRRSITAKKSRRIAKQMHVKNKKKQILKLNDLLLQIITDVESRKVTQ